MTDSMVSVLAPFINNAGASVIMMTFLFLWHKRTAARDKYFHDTLQAITMALMECVKETGEK